MAQVTGLSTISAHGRALKHERLRAGEAGDGLSTISAHGRALKQDVIANVEGVVYYLSTISAHGRALKP